MFFSCQTQGDEESTPAQLLIKYKGRFDRKYHQFSLHTTEQGASKKHQSPLLKIWQDFYFFMMKYINTNQGLLGTNSYQDLSLVHEDKVKIHNLYLLIYKN